MIMLKKEQCIYVRFSEDSSEKIILALYVDYLVIAATTQKTITTFKLTAKYECKDLAAPDRILNMEVVRTKDGGLFLSQSLHIQNVLGRFKTHLTGPSTRLNGAETPMDHRIRLHKNGSNHIRLLPKNRDIESGAEKCGAGSLLWLANGTRPDISLAVNLVAKYCCDPRVAHWNACKRLLR